MGAAQVCVKRDPGDDEVNDLLATVTSLRQEVEILKQKNQQIVSSSPVLDPCGPGVAWLNTIVSELWPKISIFVANTLKESVEPQIQAVLPSALKSGFSFGTVTLGDKPLEFESITANPEDYASRDGATRDINLKFDIMYRGDAQVVIYAAGAKVGIQDIQLEGVLSIVLKELLDQPPFISGLSVFFANTPSIKMVWNGAASVLCLIQHKVREIVKQQITNVCVLPKRIAVVLDNSKKRVFRIKAPHPSGCVVVHLLKARNLEGKDWHVFGKATSDPYAQLHVGAQEYQSQIIKKTCDPEWDEKFTFFVHDQGQNVEIVLYDEDFGKSDDFMGRVQLSVAEILDKCKSGPAWLPLGPSEDKSGDGEVNQKVQGELQVAATWMPICLDQAKAKAIVAPGVTPQAMVFMGLYSVRVPPAKAGTAYTITMSCSGKSHTVQKASVIPPEAVELQHHSTELKDKISKLRSLKATDADIAEILGIPVKALEEENPQAAQYVEKVVVEEPFLWLVDVPNLAVVDVEISEGKTQIGSYQFHVSRLLDPAVTANCTLEEKVVDGQVKFKFMAQVRVIAEA